MNPKFLALARDFAYQTLQRAVEICPAHHLEKAVVDLGAARVEIRWSSSASCAEFGVSGAWVDSGSVNDVIPKSFDLLLLDKSMIQGRPDLSWLTYCDRNPINHAMQIDAGLHLLLDSASGAISVLDSNNRRAICWVHDVEALPYWFAATPFRTLLSWMISTEGGELTHGASISLENGCVFIGAPGGSGKSTLTLACAMRGLKILGDDFVLIHDQEAKAVYNRIKCNDDTIKVMFKPQEVATRVGAILNPVGIGNKRIVQVKPELIEREPRHVTAIFVPEVTDEFAITPISAAAAFKAIALPTLEGLMGGTSATLKTVRRVSKSVPCYNLKIGKDLNQAVEAMVALAAQ